MLVRRHGSGTYTARPKVAKWLGMMGFTEDIRRRGMQPGSKMLEFRRQKARARADSKAFSARRVRYRSGPLAFARAQPVTGAGPALPALHRQRSDGGFGGGLKVPV
ncbi:hypothetical protein F1D05_21165 [Kribbella qitaiheensis]|uniref:Uncharacterized protein n=1 Tax=Kribbella qitaiheensis TaxID=1544730 RepID=A0A7G6X147_9ACTN|nr:hypothetical protein [Kribbella qitaiheensis]QNE19962.1 hypothetical protein F1D05_21165 [Kribbella qitaiheensis]